MVDVDYTYRNSDYYTKWYKQGIVPEDKLFAAYNGITNILGTVGSIFASLKSNSDDDDGKGGSGLNGTVKEDEGPSVDEKLKAKSMQKNFINSYDKWAVDTTKTPDSKLNEYANAILDDPNADNTLKTKAKKVIEVRAKYQQQIKAVETQQMGAPLITGAIGLVHNSRKSN